MNGDKKIRKIILRMAEKIKTVYNPEKIVRFGSYAWGKPIRGSDVDLFIIKKTNERHIDRAVRICEIIDEENCLVGVDVLVYTPEELSHRLNIGDVFIQKILREGEVLYG